MSENLKAKTANGIGWGFTDNVLSSGITAVANIILARILSPGDFGLIGMTAIFMTLSTSLVDSGFTGALTRKKDAGKADFDTVFHFNLAVSLLLYAVLYFTAPLIAAFFNEDILVPIIRILGIALIVNAFGIVQKVILVRRLDFRTQAIISLISSLTAGTVAVVMAFMGYGVWSLVALQVLKPAVNSLMLWVFSKWHPGLSFSGKSFREMFSFGGRLLVTSIVSTLWSEMYSIIIGKMYSKSVLG